jgi:hypothetical protein
MILKADGISGVQKIPNAPRSRSASPPPSKKHKIEGSEPYRTSAQNQVRDLIFTRYVYSAMQLKVTLYVHELWPVTCISDPYVEVFSNVLASRRRKGTDTDVC